MAATTPAADRLREALDVHARAVRLASLAAARKAEPGRALHGILPLPLVLVCECGEQMVELAERCGFCVGEEAEMMVAA